MKYSILLSEQNVWDDCPLYWQNFIINGVKHTDRGSIIENINRELEKFHCLRPVAEMAPGPVHLHFETEEDATYFILKWS